MTGISSNGIRRLAFGLLLASNLLPLAACGPGSPETSFQHKAGIYFEFPEGWSRPSPQEWRDLKLGENNTLITIMDASRKAGFSIIPVNLGPDEQFVLNYLDDDATARGVMFVEAIDKAGPGKYGQYSLISKDLANFAGAPMAEIVFEGRNPGKDLNWHRILALTTRSDALLMLVFSCPLDQLDQFQPDFYFIEDSWEWGG